MKGLAWPSEERSPSTTKLERPVIDPLKSRSTAAVKNTWRVPPVGATSASRSGFEENAPQRETFAKLTAGGRTSRRGEPETSEPPPSVTSTANNPEESSRVEEP